MILQAIRSKARWTRWTKTEDNAMKEKTSLAIMDTLYKIYENMLLSFEEYEVDEYNKLNHRYHKDVLINVNNNLTAIINRLSPIIN
ncbi:hypothetical protein RhiirB3_443296 [Rhizophagus irregularis]|nr:hypothetical protein RhiirB3_443296 [Rhizophagus irregularis]